MPQGESSIKDKTHNNIQLPSMYEVLFINDDITPMDFVIVLLTEIFFHNFEDAYNLMMKVHTEGMAVVGIYSYDIALSKISKATDISRQEGYPLRIIMRKQ